MISLVALMIAAQGAMPVQLASAQSAAEGSDQQQMVCRQRPVTGSRLRFTRVCMTRAEWNTQRENIRRGMQDHQTRAMTNVAPPVTSAGSD